MSLVELCKEGDLEEVKVALQRGVDVNTKDEHGWTGLMWAVRESHNSVVNLLLKTPNVDVNLKSDKRGNCALHAAVMSGNNEALKLLLDFPSIDVNIVAKDGQSVVHRAVSNANIEGLKLLFDVPNFNVNIVNNFGTSALHLALWRNNIEMLKLLLTHPGLTAQTLNHKDFYGATPAMMAVTEDKLEHLAVLATDLRVDLDIIERCRNQTLKVLEEAEQRREEKRRLIRAQQRKVSKVLLDGLYDSDSPISKLIGVHTEVMGEIIWQKMLVGNWQIFPDPDNPEQFQTLPMKRNPN